MMNLFYMFLVATVFYISIQSSQGEIRKVFHYYCESCINHDIPSDYTLNENFSSAYKYYQIPLNWNDARRTCRNDGAHLALIDSKEELEYITTLKKNPRSETWIGYHKIFSVDPIRPLLNWTTVLDQSVKLEPYWGQGQPDYNHERCVAIAGGPILNNLGCERGDVDGVPNDFICEIHC